MNDQSESTPIKIPEWLEVGSIIWFMHLEPETILSVNEDTGSWIGFSDYGLREHTFDELKFWRETKSIYELQSQRSVNQTFGGL
jgi:hypothetical protein